MKKLVVLTGAGVSAESGIPTFRDSGGLWEGHDVMEVASPEGWNKNPALVLDFYNQRRKKALEVKPNNGHLLIAALEDFFDVTVVTQNIDNLHEQAGSTKIIHLHGSLFESRSTANPNLLYDIDGWEINLGDKCEMGSQLRPNIVWFGEAVPMMEPAIAETHNAEVFLVVGTSLVVYPAAGLIDFVDSNVPKFVVDPNMPSIAPRPNLHLVEEVGSKGMEEIFEQLKGLA